MITDAISQTAAGQQNGAARQSTEAAATASADFDSFLRLLTAQMRNQDPLSPIDSTQFVEQLASFSTVEQQIQTNSQLEDLVASLTASDLSSASEWIGRHVEISTKSSNFAGEPLSYRIPESPSGTPTEAVVYNSSGDEILRAPIAAGQKDFTWNGTNADGNTMPYGEYFVEVNFSKDGEVVDIKSPLTIAAVTEARIIDASAKLILANGVAIDPTDVRAVHLAPEAANEETSGENTEGGDGSEVLPG